MALAIFGKLVENNPVKAFLGGKGQQLLSQSDVLFGGKTESVQDLAHRRLAFFDTLADFNFLLACEQWNPAHLLEVHANRIVQQVEAAGRLGFLLLLGGADPIGCGRIDDLDFEAAQFAMNLIEIGGGDLGIRQGIIDVVISEVTLLFGEPHQVFDFIRQIKGRLRKRVAQKDGFGRPSV